AALREVATGSGSAALLPRRRGGGRDGLEDSEVAGGERLRFSRSRRLQGAKRLRPAGVDLAPGPLQPARLLEEPVRVGGKAQTRIDANAEPLRRIVGIGQVDLGPTRRGDRRAGEQRLALPSQGGR